MVSLKKQERQTPNVCLSPLIPVRVIVRVLHHRHPIFASRGQNYAIKTRFAILYMQYRTILNSRPTENPKQSGENCDNCPNPFFCLVHSSTNYEVKSSPPSSSSLLPPSDSWVVLSTCAFNAEPCVNPYSFIACR